MCHGAISLVALRLLFSCVALRSFLFGSTLRVFTQVVFVCGPRLVLRRVFFVVISLSLVFFALVCVLLSASKDVGFSNVVVFSFQHCFLLRRAPCVVSSRLLCFGSRVFCSRSTLRVSPAETRLTVYRRFLNIDSVVAGRPRRSANIYDLRRGSSKFVSGVVYD